MTGNTSPNGRSTSPPIHGSTCIEDAFGNVTHVLTHGPIADLTINVEGLIETHDTGGVLRGTDERFPPSLFLRSTPLTEVNPAMAAFARELRAESEDDVLGFLHALMMQINEHMTFDEDPDQQRHLGGGSLRPASAGCARTTRISSSPARARGGVPARFVAGHFLRSDGMVNQEAGHAWAEAFVPDLGWVGFDPANAGLHHRRACPRRHRPRLSRRGPGARHPLWRRHGNAVGDGQGRSGRWTAGSVAVAVIFPKSSQRDVQSDLPAIGGDVVLGDLPGEGRIARDTLCDRRRGADRPGSPILAQDNRRHEIARCGYRGQRCRHRAVGVGEFVIPDHLGKGPPDPDIDARAIAEFGHRGVARLIRKRQRGKPADRCKGVGFGITVDLECAAGRCRPPDHGRSAVRPQGAAFTGMFGQHPLADRRREIIAELGGERVLVPLVSPMFDCVVMPIGTIRSTS